MITAQLEIESWKSLYYFLLKDKSQKNIGKEVKDKIHLRSSLGLDPKKQTQFKLDPHPDSDPDPDLSQVTLTSISLNTSHNRSVSSSRSNILALKVDQERLIRLRKGTRGSKSIDLAHTTQVSRADLVSGSIRGSEKLSINRRLNNSINVLENVALSQDVTTRTDLERVAAVVVPVVVHSVQESVALHLGASAAGVVDVVALHGDQVAVAVQVDAPVGVAVAGGGVVGQTVDVVVCQTDAVVAGGAEHVVLATDAGGLLLLVWFLWIVHENEDIQ